MFLKVYNEDQYHFVDLSELPSYTLKSDENYPLYENGEISFENQNGKWYIFNTAHLLWYRGLPFFKNKKRKVVPNKKIKVGKKTYISFIAKRPYKAMQPDAGLTYTVDLSMNTEFIIGRDKLADIMVSNLQMDLKNTRIINDGKSCYIEDLNSANGLIINHEKYKSKLLEDHDIISLPGICLMYYGNKLLYSMPKDGMKLDVLHMKKEVVDSRFGKKINLLKDITFSVQPGEFVAVVGGSGAGKSTLMDTINGRRKGTGGMVYYDQNNFYKYEECYLKNIGYVPQQDIMHTDLSVYKTLYYYAHIKMKHHLSKHELAELIHGVLDDVFLRDKENLKVSKLSGGQRKRVSIAMELLSDPKVLFLDEPTSGLSPDLDFEIMELLYHLSRKGKTIVVITHNMENLDKCDKIAFLGNGGYLCYYGSPDKIFTFFNVRKYGKIFNLLTKRENCIKFADKLNRSISYKKMLSDLEATYGKDGVRNV